jgi:acyl dehydratase
MLIVQRPAEMKNHVGQVLGHSDWVTIDQAMINKFAEATLDHQWIHVDVARAAKEMPGGKTIAHGFLTLSLVAGMADQVHRIEKRSRGINYGLNKVRFTAPVPSGSRVRLVQKLLRVEDIDGGVRLTYENQMEIEGQSRPALVAESMALAYD